MIRHVILFKFRPDVSKEAKEKAISGLKNLETQIPDIKEWSIGVQALPSTRAYDIAQISGFENIEALQRFRNHPAHLKSRDYLATIADWVVVDYEF